MKLKHLFSFKVNKNLTTLDLLTIIYINKYQKIVRCTL